jgi:hypothetical protein
MMDGEKRIVTFMGESGRRTATIIWKDHLNMFQVSCELPENENVKLFKLFKDESEAQAYAEEFVWEKKYGTV